MLISESIFVTLVRVVEINLDILEFMVAMIKDKSCYRYDVEH